MVAVTLSPVPVLQFFNNEGQPNAGGSLLTQVGGVNYVTYSDFAGTIALPNPIPLNSRGEVSTSTGVTSQLFLVPNTVYTFTLYDSGNNPLWSASYVNEEQLTAAQLAALLKPQTAAEIAAGVTPLNQIYDPGVIDRYGNNLIPGTTIMTSAFQSALAQQRQTGGAPMQLMPWGYAVDSNAVKIANDQIPLVIFGIPLQSYIVNKAPVNTPTIQLIDKQTFDIRGIVFVGRAGFPNLGIDLTSASGGQRTGYGKLVDIECFTNGVGLHMAGVNDVEVSNYAYWPGGESAAPGSPTFDTNAQTAGILADGVGIAAYNPGQVNLVTLRKINVGEVNSIANGGCAIKIDGSISNASTAPGAAGPFQVWTLEDFDVGASERGLWVRNVTTSTFKSMYLTAEARFDQGCALIKSEQLFGGTIVMDGTQSLGGCVSLHFLNCEAQTITGDSNNTRSLHQNCYWYAAAGAGDQDSSLGKMVLNNRITSFPLADQIGNNGLCIGEGTDTPISLSNGSVITPVGGAYQRLTNSGAVTGISITAPNSLSGVRGRILVLGNVGSGNITFAAYPGSNVADGTSCVITPLTQKTFFWDSVLGAYLHS